MKLNIVKALNFGLFFLAGFCVFGFISKFKIDLDLSLMCLYFVALITRLIFKVKKVFEDDVWSRKKFVITFAPSIAAMLLGFAWLSFKKNEILCMVFFVAVALITTGLPLLFIPFKKKNKNK